MKTRISVASIGIDSIPGTSPNARIVNILLFYSANIILNILGFSLEIDILFKKINTLNLPLQPSN